MAKQNQAAEAKSDKKSWAKVKPIVIEELTDDLAYLAQLPGGPIIAAGDGTIQAQAARLGDVRLQSAQRHALAAQIGRVQGNRHLQRVVASLKRDEEPTSDRLGNRVGQETLVDKAVQREVQVVGESRGNGLLAPELEQRLQQRGSHKLRHKQTLDNQLSGKRLISAQQRVWATRFGQRAHGHDHLSSQAKATVDDPTQAQAVSRVQTARSQVPISSSLAQIAHLASRAAADPGIAIAFAGSPVEKSAPGGVSFIRSKSGGGISFAWTGTVKAGVFTAPSVRTNVTTIKKDHQREHFAELKPTTSADATHFCYYPGPGDHEIPGMTKKIGGKTYKRYYRISQEISELARKGEQEHLNDALRAYNITYKLIADQINSLAGQRFGPARSPYEAKQQAYAALEKKLPKQLGTEPGGWAKMLDTLLVATRFRDLKLWHELEAGSEQKIGTKFIRPVKETEMTNIGVPSSEVINYPSEETKSGEGHTSPEAASMGYEERRLSAHEVAHVLQRNVIGIMRKPDDEKTKKTANPTPARQQVPGNQAVQHSAPGPAELDEETTARIHRERGSGQSLGSAVRAQMKAVSFGSDFSYAYGGEKPLSRAFATCKADAMKAVSFGSDFSYTYGGEKPLSGAFATWIAPEGPVKEHVEKKGGKWFVVLDQFDMKGKYWLNSNATWNHIKDFPGGSWVASFNTKEGSKAHEEAELKAMGEVWNNAESNIKLKINKGFNTQNKAVANYNKVSASEHVIYKTKYLAIKHHKNRVGPDAEWDYYKREYQRYHASLKKKTP